MRKKKLFYMQLKYRLNVFMRFFNIYIFNFRNEVLFYYFNYQIKLMM